MSVKRGWRSTSSPGRFSLALEVGREKDLASAGYMTTKHPEFVGVPAVTFHRLILNLFK